MFTKYQRVVYQPSEKWFQKKIRYDDLEEDLQEESHQLFERAVQCLTPSYSIMLGTRENFVMHEESPDNSYAEMDFCNKHYSGKMLTALQGVSTVMAYIITCGMGMEDFDTSAYDEFLIDYWVDVLKTEAMVVAQKECRIFTKDFLSVDSLSSVAPGTGEMQLWSITQLGPLFNTITESVPSDAHMVRDAYMLPNKTLCGLMFSSSRPYFSCSECKRKNCPERTVPYGWVKSQKK